MSDWHRMNSQFAETVYERNSRLKKQRLEKNKMRVTPPESGCGMSGNNQRPLGKSPLADAIFENIKSQSDAFAAASKAGLEQGRIIGRREMKPLIRELMGMLKDVRMAYNIEDHALDDLIVDALRAIDGPLAEEQKP